MTLRFFAALGFLAAFSLSCSITPRTQSGWVTITEQTDKLRIEVGGQPFTEYHFKNAPHVYFFPLLGPGGVPMSRSWPMKEVEGEEKDHPHHRSLWYSHGAVNGIDFWSETPKAGKIVHDKFLEVKSGEESGVIRSLNMWVAPDGSVMCTSDHIFRVFVRSSNVRLLDHAVTLKA